MSHVSGLGSGVGTPGMTFHAWIDEASAALERARDAATSAIASRDPLFLIQNILATEHITADQLSAILHEARISPQTFTETLFKAWFEPGIAIPNAAQELIRSHPSFRNPNAPWSVFLYAQELLQSGRGDQNAKQMAILEWIHFIIGREGNTPSFYASALSQDGSIGRMLTDYINRLTVACEWQWNQPVEEIFAEALTESDTINRLCGILAHTPHHDGVVQDLKVQLWWAWEQMAWILERTGKYPALVKLSQEAGGRYLCNFGPCIAWGDTPEAIHAQRLEAIDSMEKGFDLQSRGEFWWKLWRPERARADKQGNLHLIDLKALRAIQEIKPDRLTEGAEKLKKDALQALRNLYRDRCDPRGIYLHSNDVIQHFLGVLAQNAEDERKTPSKQQENNLKDYGIETVRHLVQFDNTIPVEILCTLAQHFVRTRYINPVFETFRIQILDAVIKRLSPENEQHQELVHTIHNTVDHDGYSGWSAYDYASLYASISFFWWHITETVYCTQIDLKRESPQERTMRANFQSILLVDPDILFPKGSPLANSIGAERVRRAGVDPTTPGLETVVRNYGTDILSGKYREHAQSVINKLAKKYTHPDPGLDIKKVLDGLASEVRREIFFQMCQIRVITWSHDHIPTPAGYTRHPISASGVNFELTYPSLLETSMDRLIEKHWQDLRDIIEKMIANHRSNAELQASSEILRKMAYYSDLTGLPKEAQLQRDIEAVWQEKLNIAFIRIRGFKDVWNIDRSAAKELSSKLALLLKQHFEDSDVTIYHPSYSTFAITGVRDVAGFRELIEEFIPFVTDDLDFANGFEVGGVYNWTGAWDYDLISLASFALGESAAHPNKVHWLREGAENASRIVLGHTTILKDALSQDPNHRLEVHYQPIHDPENPDNRYLEALVRILQIDEDTEDPDQSKLILPGSFLPIARQNGLIPHMTKLVLERVRQDLVRHPNIKSVAVNIDGPAWRSEEIMELLADIAWDCRITWRLPVLEILETVKLGGDKYSLEQDLAKIKYLRGLWYTFAIDDYGAGESNVLNAAILQPEIYKLDHRFVLLVQNPDLRDSIIAQIRGLVGSIKSHNPDAVIVAEHIESKELLNLFKELGVTRFQGFHIGRPSRLSDLIPQEQLHGEADDIGQWRLL